MASREIWQISLKKVSSMIFKKQQQRTRFMRKYLERLYVDMDSLNEQPLRLSSPKERDGFKNKLFKLDGRTCGNWSDIG